MSRTINQIILHLSFSKNPQMLEIGTVTLFCAILGRSQSPAHTCRMCMYYVNSALRRWKSFISGGGLGVDGYHLEPNWR